MNILIALAYIITLNAQEMDSGFQDIVISGAGSLLETSTAADRFVDTLINFSIEFALVPKVAVGFVKYKISNAQNKHTGMQMVVSDITRKDFKVKTICFSQVPIQKFQISWFASSDPNILIELDEVTDATAVATGTGYREVVRPYFPTGITQTALTKVVSIINGYRITTTTPPVNIGSSYYDLNPIKKTIWVRDTTCITWLSQYIIVSNLQNGYSGYLLDNAGFPQGYSSKVVSYGVDIGLNQQAIFGIMEFWAAGNGELDIELKNLQFTPTQFRLDMGQGNSIILNLYSSATQNTLPLLVYSYMVIRQCVKIYPQCNFQGTEITVCSMDPQSQTVTGSGKKIFFKTDTAKKTTVTFISRNKKCIYNQDFTSFEII